METNEVIWAIYFVVMGAVAIAGWTHITYVAVTAKKEGDSDPFDVAEWVPAVAMLALMWPVAAAAAVIYGVTRLLSLPWVRKHGREMAERLHDGDYVVAIMDDGTVLDGIIGGDCAYIITADGQADFDPDRDTWRRVERQSVKA